MASYIEYFLRHLFSRLHTSCDSSNFLWFFFIVSASRKIPSYYVRIPTFVPLFRFCNFGELFQFPDEFLKYYFRIPTFVPVSEFLEFSPTILILQTIFSDYFQILIVVLMKFRMYRK